MIILWLLLFIKYTVSVEDEVNSLSLTTEDKAFVQQLTDDESKGENVDLRPEDGFIPFTERRPRAVFKFMMRYCKTVVNRYDRVDKKRKEGALTHEFLKNDFIASYNYGVRGGLYDDDSQYFVDGELLYKGVDDIAKSRYFDVNLIKYTPATVCGKWSCACEEWFEEGGFTYGFNWIRIRAAVFVEVPRLFHLNTKRVAFNRLVFNTQTGKVAKESFLDKNSNKWAKAFFGAAIITSTKAVDFAEYIGLVEDQTQGTAKYIELVSNALYMILALFAAFIGIFICWMMTKFANLNTKKGLYSKVAMREDV